MAEGKVSVHGGSTLESESRPVAAEDEARARGHIAKITAVHRGARGKSEAVSAPRSRGLGRRLQLGAIWLTEVLGDGWRRITDSHRLPGRWANRMYLFRPTKTLAPWVWVWLAVVAVCGYFFFRTDPGAEARWLAGWAFSAAFAALVAVLWHDLIKSPHTAWRVRRQIISDPELLLGETLAKRATKVVELDPPVNTVSRDTLYEELLPGVLPRAKDVQIVVGEPGSGKTTALVDMASLLAKMGFVPVLLELRGKRATESLFEIARKRFEGQIRPLITTSADAEAVWRWLCQRQRVVILIDDIDQIGFDGEPGFLMKRMLEELKKENLAVIATARPAGVPAGIAASAVDLAPLEFQTAVDLVAEPAPREPGATTTGPPPRPRIERWIAGGELTRAPLYLEALAELTSVGVCPDLPDDPLRWGTPERPGRWRKLSERRQAWNPVWVRFLLLDQFYRHVIDGDVRRSLAIDRPDRERSMDALAGAALGALAATGLEAAAAATRGCADDERQVEPPQRTKLVDFISTDDRGGPPAKEQVDSKMPRRRQRVSQFEAIDTGLRLRILETDSGGEPQFRHRILQAFFAGRRLAEIGCDEKKGEEWHGREIEWGHRSPMEHLTEFADWVEALADRRHPEKLTAQLTLAFAAIYADERALQDPGGPGGDWDGLGLWIADQLVRAGRAAATGSADPQAFPLPASADGSEETLDPMVLPDPHARTDPDDELIKLTTAAEIVALLRPREQSERIDRLDTEIMDLVAANQGAMSWTKLQLLPAIAALDTPDSWGVLWKKFTRDSDYEVRRTASKQLEQNACRAYPKLRDKIERRILQAGLRAANGEPLQATGVEDGWLKQDSVRAFMALGWVLPPIVSGLGEELRVDSGYEAETDGDKADGGDKREKGNDSAQACFQHSRRQLEDFTALAYEGGRHEMEESLAQGFKADAMRHAADPSRHFTGPGWVASNRRLVADIALPHAESWYARKLLYQALALYAIAGTARQDTLDMLAFRLNPTRERHPLARQAAKLSRAAVHRAELGRERWRAFVWSDEVEEAGRLPIGLSRKAAQLVGDVALLVDLKEGSPPDRHRNFGHMEELPYCLSASKNRHEILGNGCPEQCGWGFCPYRAGSPDEPNDHRGLARGFCRGERRLAMEQRPPVWQRAISRRRLREFWEQMEYKARR